MKRISILLLLAFILVMPTLKASDFYSLNSDNNVLWKVYPVKSLTQSASKISEVGFDVSGWINSTVPGTWYVDYINAGLEANPDFGDNIYKVDESKYNQAFWYRTEVDIPKSFDKDRIYLHFENVNKEGTFYFNGKQLGKVKGHSLRSKYDVTDKVKEGKNVILVRVDIPDVRNHREPTWALDTWANFAMPSFMASASWDWMPYVPGLNCGITGDIYFTNTNSVSLSDSWVRSELTTKNSSAHLSVQTTLINSSEATVSGTLKGVLMPGNIEFSKVINLEAKEEVIIVLDKDEFSQLTIVEPSLWWPNGYGEPNLYTCSLEFLVDDKVSDKEELSFGIKKYEYKKENGAFTLYVNGSKVLLRGGNWGMTEYLQRSRGDEYDTRIKLHQDMNYNMIRLWTGCVTDDEFYEYCDKYGIMVWDDFWFHGKLFAPDEDVFMSNAIDKIKRLRNHPCVAVWCGANEGVPGGEEGKGIDLKLKEAVRDYDGNDRHYQTSSNSGGGLSGSGWWVNQHPKTYFDGPASAGGGDWGGAGTWALRTEIGTATFTTFESFKEFMPVEDWWPKNEMWNKHFFGSQAGTANTDHYFNTVNQNYGSSKEIDEFCEKSQYLNMEVMKAIYEGWNDNMWNNATGVLIWMSQSAYPSFVWQTYDYYYDATGAYWGAKKACEPLHIQWNHSNNSVKVINTTLNDYTGLKAKATVYNLDGSVYEPLCMEEIVNSSSNSATESFVLLEESGMNLALNKITSASGSDLTFGNHVHSNAVDGNNSTRWQANNDNDAWFYVDLGEKLEIAKVFIKWEGAYARKFKIQVSEDAETWTDVFTQDNGKGGDETITFDSVITRYVKMQGVERAIGYGYSLWEFEVYPPATGGTQVLSDLNFVKLELLDENNKLISENFYWRNMKEYNYKALNTLPLADVSLTESQSKEAGKVKIVCQLKNNSTTVAFGNRLKVINKDTKKRVLPIYMNDNYFTLMPGESKTINIEFDESLVGDADVEVVLRQYGDYDSTPPLAIEDVEEDNNRFSDIKLYPNPVTDVLSVENNLQSVKEIIVFDLNGKRVAEAVNTNRIDLSFLRKGIYLVRTVAGENVYNSKVIKK
ncbi:discoidin domain-containing protein [Bacteroidales bacterium OttesenSCG-928-I14]|nr:discoidin domain-containing protein [Bacteroidales bacterium OttesenSCG-928-I14]